MRAVLSCMEATVEVELVIMFREDIAGEYGYVVEAST